MFTGLVEETGECLEKLNTSGGRRLLIASPRVTACCQLGDSLAVDGCCLTVVAKEGRSVAFDVLAETLRCTNLGRLEPGHTVNLERPLAANARLGGHFVQGHVDAAVPVLSTSEVGPDLRLEISLPAHLAPYVASKGSVALNGVSLTVASLEAGSFTVWIIPHTRAVTNLGFLQAGDLVNLETDILAKYAERILRCS